MHKFIAVNKSIAYTTSKMRKWDNQIMNEVRHPTASPSHSIGCVCRFYVGCRLFAGGRCALGGL